MRRIARRRFSTPCYHAVANVREGEAPRDAFARIRRRLLSYDVFPPALMTHSVERGHTLNKGALIVQSVGLASLRLEFAVRVVDVWDHEAGETADTGLTYVTLEGHPERGWETFRVTLSSDRVVALTIEARSTPGTMPTRLGRPVARLVQVAATRAAVRRLRGPKPR